MASTAIVVMSPRTASISVTARASQLDPRPVALDGERGRRRDPAVAAGWVASTRAVASTRSPVMSSTV
jgi:hypothetical protein